MTPNNYLHVMNVHTEIMLPATAQLFANAHSAVFKRHDLPFAVVNGCLVPDERMVEGGVQEGCVCEWTYEHKGELKVSALQVGCVCIYVCILSSGTN
jgi:hypothetical protein